MYILGIWLMLLSRVTSENTVSRSVRLQVTARVKKQQQKKNAASIQIQLDAFMSCA